MGNEINLEEISGRLPDDNGNKTPEAKEPRTHLQYGLIAGLVLIVLFVLYAVIGWSFKGGVIRWIPSIVFMLLILLAQFTHAKAVNGYITYGNLFAKGFKTAAVATCIYVVFLIIFLLVDPSYKERVLEMSREGMVEKGMSSDQIKPAMAMVRKFFMVSTIAGAVIGELVLGLIASLVGAAVAPKKSKEEVMALR